jgi:hypothetical protein
MGVKRSVRLLVVGTPSLHDSDRDRIGVRVLDAGAAERAPDFDLLVAQLIDGDILP